MIELERPLVYSREAGFMISKLVGRGHLRQQLDTYPVLLFILLIDDDILAYAAHLGFPFELMHGGLLSIIFVGLKRVLLIVFSNGLQSGNALSRHSIDELYRGLMLGTDRLRFLCAADETASSSLRDHDVWVSVGSVHRIRESALQVPSFFSATTARAAALSAVASTAFAT